MYDYRRSGATLSDRRGRAATVSQNESSDDYCFRCCLPDESLMSPNGLRAGHYAEQMPPFCFIGYSPEYSPNMLSKSTGVFRAARAADRTPPAGGAGVNK